MWSFQENIYRTKRINNTIIPEITLQNINNSVECSETGEIFLSNFTANSTAILEIQNPTLSTEGTATYSYNSPIQNTIHNSSNSTPIYINVDTDINGEATITYSIDADLNSDGDGSYNGVVTIVDGAFNQIAGTSTVSISDSCIAPDNLIINEEQAEDFDGGCTTCASVTVLVPASQTRQVEFIKTGIGPYGNPGVLCTSIGTGVLADNIYNISTDTAFDFGIDAAKGSVPQNTANTTIQMIIRDGATVLETYNLNRTHRDPVINC